MTRYTCTCFYPYIHTHTYMYPITLHICTCTCIMLKLICTHRCKDCYMHPQLMCIITCICLLVLDPTMSKDKVHSGRCRGGGPRGPRPPLFLNVPSVCFAMRVHIIFAHMYTIPRMERSGSGLSFSKFLDPPLINAYVCDLSVTIVNTCTCIP